MPWSPLHATFSLPPFAGVEYVYDRARDWQGRVRIRMLHSQTYEESVAHVGRLVTSSGVNGGVRLAVIAEVEGTPFWAAHRTQDCLWAGLACAVAAAPSHNNPDNPQLISLVPRMSKVYQRCELYKPCM